MAPLQIDLGRGIIISTEKGSIVITELDASGTDTSKAVTLTSHQWNKLIDYSKDILADFERQKQDNEVNAVYDLSDELRVRINHPFWLADIRQWYTATTGDKQGQLLPTRRGVKIHHLEFAKLISADTRVQTFIAELNETSHPPELSNVAGPPPAERA